MTLTKHIKPAQQGKEGVALVTALGLLLVFAMLGEDGYGAGRQRGKAIVRRPPYDPPFIDKRTLVDGFFLIVRANVDSIKPQAHYNIQGIGTAR